MQPPDGVATAGGLASAPKQVMATSPPPSQTAQLVTTAVTTGTLVKAGCGDFVPAVAIHLGTTGVHQRTEADGSMDPALKRRRTGEPNPF